MDNLTISQIVDGYSLTAAARRLSPNTISEYQNTYRKFIQVVGDRPFSDLDKSEIERFLSNQPGISKKTVLNYHTGLSALYTWAIREGLVQENLLHKIPRPRPEKHEIIPLSQDEVKRLLSSLEKSRAYSRPGKRLTGHALPCVTRNRAMILLLLDTGMRATEICSLAISDIDMKYRRISVFGKGSKHRTVPFSERTGQVLWRYLVTRKDARPDDPAFQTSMRRPLDRGQLLRMLRNLSHRAGITGVHPHRFRHTFAVNYLKNGGDPYTLQALLGHESMEMVRRYLHLSQIDLDQSHHRASPVENWRL